MVENAADPTVAHTPGGAGSPALSRLLDLVDPPDFLYVRGRLPEGARWIAIVGSRAASRYGLVVAARLAEDLAHLDLPIVSGLAHGVDAAAHRAALEAGGHTVAVLPGGVDTVVPAFHRDLARDILARGALASEYASGPPFGPGAFVRRNRLIAALASVVVVVEAASRSGALVTARIAAQIGRPVLAVPGDLDRPTSMGPLDLLRSGARPCGGVADVLAALDPESEGERPAHTTKTTSPMTSQIGPESALLARLDGTGRTVDELAHAAGLELPAVLDGLLRLEWSGLARALPGGRWRREGVA